MEDKKFKILLVEDNTIVQQTVTLILTSKFGCHVTLATSGEEALQMTNENVYNLLFMDIGLPGMDGIETTLKIRLHEGLNHETPVVALTAHTDAHTRQKCTDAGMNGFLAKPFTDSEIKEVLTQFGWLAED